MPNHATTTTPHHQPGPAPVHDIPVYAASGGVMSVAPGVEAAAISFVTQTASVPQGNVPLGPGSYIEPGTAPGQYNFSLVPAPAAPAGAAPPAPPSQQGTQWFDHVRLGTVGGGNVVVGTGRLASGGAQPSGPNGVLNCRPLEHAPFLSSCSAAYASTRPYPLLLRGSPHALLPL